MTTAERITAALTGAGITLPENATASDTTRALMAASAVHKGAENEAWAQLSRLRNDARREAVRATARTQREKHAECIALLDAAKVQP